MNKRLSMADGVRVLSIGIIMWFHIWQQSWLEPSVTIAGKLIDLQPMVRTGYILVDIMLMLSGYLLMIPIARGSEIKPLEFYKKRLIRILPCYLLSVFVMLFCFALPGNEYYTKQAMWKDIITHLTFTHTFFADTYVYTHLNVVLWTLAIEMQFYLIFPCLCRAFRKKPVLCYAVMTGIAFAFRAFAAKSDINIDLLLNQLPGMLDVYANGMMAALITVEFEKHDHGKYAKIFFTSLLIFAFILMWRLFEKQYAMSFPMDERKLGQLINRYELSLLGAVILVSGENSFLYIRKLFGNRVTRFLSNISFNAYIWHQVLAVKLKAWRFPPYVSDSPNSAGEMPWQWTYTVACFAISIILSIAITYLYDAPITKKLTKICVRRT